MLFDSYLALASPRASFPLASLPPRNDKTTERRHKLGIVDGLLSVTHKAWMDPIRERDGVAEAA